MFVTKTSVINLGVMNFVPFKCIWSIQINKVEVCNFKLTVFHEIHVKVFTLHHILKLNFIHFLLKMCVCDAFTVNLLPQVCTSPTYVFYLW